MGWLRIRIDCRTSYGRERKFVDVGSDLFLDNGSLLGVFGELMRVSILVAKGVLA